MQHSCFGCSLVDGLGHHRDDLVLLVQQETLKRVRPGGGIQREGLGCGGRRLDVRLDDSFNGCFDVSSDDSFDVCFDDSFDVSVDDSGGISVDVPVDVPRLRRSGRSHGKFLKKNVFEIFFDVDFILKLMLIQNLLILSKIIDCYIQIEKKNFIRRLHKIDNELKASGFTKELDRQFEQVSFSF